jgi:hypothetical protein
VLFIFFVFGIFIFRIVFREDLIGIDVLHESVEDLKNEIWRKMKCLERREREKERER